MLLVNAELATIQLAWFRLKTRGVMSIFLLSAFSSSKLSSVAFNSTPLLRTPQWIVSIHPTVVNFLRQIYVYCTAAVCCAVAAAVGSRGEVPLAGNIGSRRRRRIMQQEVRAVRKLGLSLGVPVFEEFSQLAQERKSTLSQVVRLALGLGRVALTELKKGNRLLIVSAEGAALKELVLPRV